MQRCFLVLGTLVATLALWPPGLGWSQTSPGRQPVAVSVSQVTINPDGSATFLIAAPGCAADPPGQFGLVIDVPGFDGPIALGRFESPGEGSADISAADLANPAYHRTFIIDVVCNDSSLEGTETFTIAQVATPVSATPSFTG
jgi:hypothetical protein